MGVPSGATRSGWTASRPDTRAASAHARERVPTMLEGVHHRPCRVAAPVTAAVGTGA